MPRTSSSQRAARSIFRPFNNTPLTLLRSTR
jgi:hypothetical protein